MLLRQTLTGNLVLRKKFQQFVCIADSFKNKLIHSFIGNQSNEM